MLGKFLGKWSQGLDLLSPCEPSNSSLNVMLTLLAFSPAFLSGCNFGFEVFTKQGFLLCVEIRVPLGTQ